MTGRLAAVAISLPASGPLACRRAPESACTLCPSQPQVRRLPRHDEADA